ncbi:MAG TPA: DEAD/DEAH box helicase [Candidatus Eisenbacteria bacterium]|nr:DEAD/DEAH box helicase [Candidatus Eisenbacteria bacterium]
MSIRLEKQGKRILLIANGTPLTGIKTTVPGAYYNASGTWTVPLSIESCRLLKLRFGEKLIASNELKRWIAGVQTARRQMKRLAAQTDAKLYHLPRKAPRLYKAMGTRPYQRVGVRFIADNHATLIADDPGLGKTLICMGGILESEVPGPYLIIAPKTAAESVWQREIERWLPKPHKAIVMPQLRAKRERILRMTRPTAETWIIVHPEMVLAQLWLTCQQCGKRAPAGNNQQTILPCNHEKTPQTKRELIHSFPRLFEIEWGAVVIDESHESLIRRSGKPTQRRRGMDALKVRGDGLRIAMSGTPFDSKPHQLWGTLNWLDPVQYSAFNRWAELYWQKGGYTGYEIGEFRKERESMLWDSLSAISLRRTKAEVAPDLPPKTYAGTPLNPNDADSPIGVWLEMDGKQARAYEQMEKLSVSELESGRLEAVSALAELTRLKQLACAYGDITKKRVRGQCEENGWCAGCRTIGYHWEDKLIYTPTLPSNKFNWIVQSLEEWGYPRNPLTKVVIVSFYTGILNLFATALEKHFKRKPDDPLCTAITGQTPPNRRRQIIDRFNTGAGPDVMMLNVKAGGTAITLDTADRMIFISETRSPDIQKQAEDRIHRVSNPRNCMYYYLRSVGTVDIGTAIINEELREQTHRLLDTRRGVDYLRQVMGLSK